MTRQWSEEGHEISVLCGTMHANGKEKREEYKGKYFVHKKHNKVDVWRCHVSESYNNGFVGRLWGYFSFVFSSIYVGLFKVREKHDIILVTSPPLFVGITAHVLSKFKRIPFVFEIRDLWPESAIDTGVVTNKWIIKFSYWFEAFIYKKAKLINVLTPAFKEALIMKKKVAEEKIIFIPNAADFAISDAILESNFDVIEFRKNQGWDQKFVITYVGAHGVANHLIQVIQTAEIIKDSLPNVLLVLIGNGMEKETLIKEAQSKSCNNIQFIDSVPKTEVFKYIIASDFGMSVLKKVDTFKTIYSNKTFDYMACKKPLFLLIDGVSRQLVEEAKCGIYVEPENPREFSERIKETLNLSDEAIKNMGENGYNFAKKNFDRSVLAKKYMNYLMAVKGSHV